MGFLFRNKKPVVKNNNSDQILIRAIDGDDEARNMLIDMYTPFILKVAAQVSGRYIRVGEDDEVSVGMMAFNEAINSFNRAKNIAFLTFAETVIKRRLIDYYRKEKRYKNYIPFSALESDTDENSEASTINYIEAKKSIAEYNQMNQSDERKQEIIEYTKVLNDYGISFSELVQISPKHEDARRRSMEVAKIIAVNADLMNHLKFKKGLPLKQILEKVDISRKTLERQRKYIIAIVMILDNNFPYLKEYIQKGL